MSEPIALKYRAFISYSHADQDWAKWLHRAIESFPIGKDLAGRFTERGEIPSALRPVFRDRDEFTAGGGLSEQTLAALDASRALIVICSLNAANSRYVNEEVRLFKSRHPDRLVVPLIVDGKPGDAERECFPPALRFEVDAKGRITKRPVELLAADAREEADGKDLALAKIGAGLLGLPSDEVFRRAERERRAAARRKRRVQAAIGALAILLGAGVLAWWQQGYIKEQYYWHAAMGPAVPTAAEERSFETGAVFTDCRIGCPEMVVVPAGVFTMGSLAGTGNADEHPQHEVRIAAPLAVSRYEITSGERQTCIDAGACDPSDAHGHMERPAVNVTWEQVKQYVAWLSRATGKRYRILSESEWEYSARAGKAALYSFGDDEALLGRFAATGRIRLVGQREPNAFGLFDVHGNAAEWVEDCYRENYVGAPSDGSAWTGQCSYRVVRGGSWDDPPAKLRSAARSVAPAGYAQPTVGFRVARDLER
jgi:formylglycine-generating enzyme required for sulfatase activity